MKLRLNLTNSEVNDLSEGIVGRRVSSIEKDAQGYYLVLDGSAPLEAPRQRIPAPAVFSTQEQIREQFNQLLERYVYVNQRKGIHPEDDLRNDHDVDSLDMVEIVMAVEDIFGVDVSDEEADRIRTVQDAYNLLYKKLL